MKSPRSSGKQKIKRRRISIRRIDGQSMIPALMPGNIIIVHSFYRKLVRGDIVVFEHEGLEKIKRVTKIDGDKVYVLGDNRTSSTDSRSFGWIDKQAVKGKVITV